MDSTRTIRILQSAIRNPKSPMHPAAFDEQALLAECDVRRQRRSGPGGQHRNKVETAVVITHVPSGIRGEASERRSQEQNRRQAVFRLRVTLAVEFRQQLDPANFVPSQRWSGRCQQGRVVVAAQHDDFPALLAEALDVLAACDMEAKSAATLLGCSTSQLIKFLQNEPRAIGQVNERRRAAGRPVYR